MSDEGGRDIVMERDETVEISHRSWFSRVGDALVGFVVGLLLLLAAAGGMLWNEARAVRTSRSLGEGAAALLEVEARRPDPSNQGRLVHVAGPVHAGPPPRDAELALDPPPGTLRLERIVQMFQWREDERRETHTHAGGGSETVTTWTYRREWMEGRAASERFHTREGHQNPQPRLASQRWEAPDVWVGGFQLTPEQLRRLPADEVYLPAGLPGVEGGHRYLGGNPALPRVGDLRVSWRIARPAQLSVIGAQSREGFAPYATHAGDRLFMLAAGEVEPARMFGQAERDNIVLTWLLRALGAGVIFGATVLVLAPAKALADVIPPLGALVGAGSAVVALLVTLVAAPVVIALAWFAVRPGLAIALVASGLLAGYAAWWLRRRPAAA